MGVAASWLQGQGNVVMDVGVVMVGSGVVSGGRVCGVVVLIIAVIHVVTHSWVVLWHVRVVIICRYWVISPTGLLRFL